jgi:transglutaminase-like putative cysteine protease
VVVFENDYSPPSEAYYFRQEALSQFTGSRLVRSTRADADLDILETLPARRARIPGAPSPEGRAHVLARVALLADHAQPFALETPVSFEPLRNPNPARFVSAYRFEALAQATGYLELIGRRVGNPRWSEGLREHYLNAPRDPRYRELAERILAGLPAPRQADPFARAVAVKVFLDESLIYSTAERHANAPDPVAAVLFGNRTGYCVHFAHAAVYLWRALGIPSRVGAGYMAEESSRRGGSTLLLRASDAHAWPELYVEGLGWVVLDVNPARTLDPPRPPPDEELQRELGELVRESPPDPLDTAVRAPAPSERRSLLDLVADAIWVLLSLAVALLWASYLVKLWRRLRPRFASRRSLLRVQYRAVLDSLAEAGHLRSSGETREAFARRLAPLTPSLLALTELHVAARYRDPAASAADASAAARRGRTLARAVHAELASKVPAWRRLAGALHPVVHFYIR